MSKNAHCSYYSWNSATNCFLIAHLTTATSVQIDKLLLVDEENPEFPPKKSQTVLIFFGFRKILVQNKVLYHFFMGHISTQRNLKEKICFPGLEIWWVEVATVQKQPIVLHFPIYFLPKLILKFLNQGRIWQFSYLPKISF